MDKELLFQRLFFENEDNPFDSISKEFNISLQEVGDFYVKFKAERAEEIIEIRRAKELYNSSYNIVKDIQ